jgi:hypothetical protein
MNLGALAVEPRLGDEAGVRESLWSVSRLESIAGMNSTPAEYPRSAGWQSGGKLSRRELVHLEAGSSKCLAQRAEDRPLAAIRRRGPALHSKSNRLEILGIA